MPLSVHSKMESVNYRLLAPRSSLLSLSTSVSLQTSSSDGIFDGILATFHYRTHTGQAFPARLNIIARYVERMLSSASLTGHP
jgi:hypothetical protein